MKKLKPGDTIRIAKRYVRSVDLIRDLRDPDALQGYVVTPSVRDAAGRILSGLRGSSTQRAFRVTGPYGVGKSAFGLLLARLVGDRSRRAGSPWKLLQDAGVEIPGDIPPYTPLVLVGRRANLADCILAAVTDAAKGAGGAKRAAGVAKTGASLQRAREKGSRDDGAVLDLLSSYARETKMGVLLLIDEMGRFLEYAALHRREIDPSFFQQIAERAGGARGHGVAVVGFLHHRFSDYAAGLGEWVEAEWTRSAERYEDVLFHDSTEQTAFLLAHAIVHEPAPANEIVADAKRVYKEAVARGVFSTSVAEISKAAPSLFPLHPAAVTALSNVAGRFGQNERSVFSFLQSLEPFGFQRFIHGSGRKAGDWYRVADLYDYVSAQGGERFRSADRERRWELVKDALAHASSRDEVDLAVLKTVGLISVLEPVPGLRADAGTIAWCCGMAKSAAGSSLKRLTERNVLYRRPHRDDYSLWASTSVDLDGWLQEARTNVPDVKRLDSAFASLSSRSVLVAHHHYHTTGTLRAFAVVAWNGQGDFSPELPPDCDGAVVVVPYYPDEDGNAVRKRVAASAAAASRTLLCCVRKVGASELATAHELAVWRWINSNCAELQMDQIALREVRSRISAAEDALDGALRPFADPGGSQEETWLHMGKPVRLESKRALNRKLSEICDEVFTAGPVLRNELVNRSRLSSATAMARMKLLEAMVQSGPLPYLGLTGAPPERTIYLSMFHSSRMHRPSAGETWDFAPPDRDDKMNWRPTWKAIDTLLREKGTTTFEELGAELAKPPIGLRAGPALLVLAAFMLHHRKEVALLERNTFQPEITPAHFMRLAKTPSNFALRYIGTSRSALELLERMSSDLVIWRDGPKPEPVIKGVVEAIYRWWNAAQTYARETSAVSKTAQAVRSALRKGQDPVDLVFRQLPEACDVPAFELGKRNARQLDQFMETLNGALEEISDAPRHLRSKAVAGITDAFDARSLGGLRSLVKEQYGPHRLQLSDYRLRAFVDRASESGMSDDAWLDGVASLLTGKRLDAWGDDTADTFTFESKAIAGRLLRWLAHMKKKGEGESNLLTVHVVDTGGHERMTVVRPGTLTAASAGLVKDIKSLLSRASDPASVLAHVMADPTVTAESKRNPKEKADG